MFVANLSWNALNILTTFGGNKVLVWYKFYVFCLPRSGAKLKMYLTTIKINVVKILPQAHSTRKLKMETKTQTEKLNLLNYYDNGG